MLDCRDDGSRCGSAAASDNVMSARFASSSSSTAAAITDGESIGMVLAGDTPTVLAGELRVLAE